MLIATVKELILHSVSHTGEIVTIWENPDTTFTKYSLRNDTEDPVHITTYETYEEVVESLKLHSWILQGVRSSKLQEMIQKQL